MFYSTLRLFTPSLSNLVTLQEGEGYFFYLLALSGNEIQQE
jgi:hypothetical protein